jgi:hypothetical protein
VVELQPLFTLRTGRRDDGRRLLERALAMAATIPSFLERRLRREWEAASRIL